MTKPCGNYLIPIATLVAVVALLSACGVPTQNDVVFEIMDATGGKVGKVVPLTTSKSLDVGALDDAAQTWLGLGWQLGNASLCKEQVPKTWTHVRAFDYSDAMIDLKDTKTYNLRLCAMQLSNPKSIAAIGLIVSTQKLVPARTNPN